MPNESLYEEYASFQDFRTDGYVVINNFLSRTELKVLRQECNVLVKHAFEHLAIQGAAQPGWEVVKKGCIFESLPGKPSRLLAGDRDTYVQQRSLWPCCPTACKLLLGTKVTHLVATLLGCPSANMHDCPRLFNDQYIVKPPTCVASGFAWHQDSDWCLERANGCSQYLSLWCALDDMSQENGCLQVRVCAADEQVHDAKCLPVKAGTAIIMSDRLLHCSSANMSKHTRRAWMPQFSKTSILSHKDSAPVSFAVPIIAA